jgi:uncharacterized protein (TIRG00374 family)
MGALGRSPRAWLGLAVSLAFLGLIARTVDWAHTAAALREADWRLVGAGAGALVGTLAIFSVRWQVLLAGTVRLPLASTFSYVMIGYLANTVLPLRLGDLARAALTGRRHGVDAPRVFGSILLERVMDLLVLLCLLLATSLAIDVPPTVRAAMAALAAVGLGALTVLGLLAAAGDRLSDLASLLPGFVPRGPVDLLLGWTTRLAGGLRTLRSARQLGEALALSVLAWTLAGLGTYCWVQAFHLPVPWYGGLFVLAVINLGGAIPSSPGAIGVYHYLAMLALSVWVTDQGAALAYAIGTHGVNVVLNLVIGCACLAREGVAVGSMTALPSYAPEVPTPGTATA